MARGGPDRPDGDDQIGGLTDKELSDLILDEAFVRAAAVKEPAAADRDTAGPIAAPPRPPRLRLAPPPRTRAPFTWVRRRLATIIVVVLVAAMVAGSVGPFAARRPAETPPDDGAEPSTPAEPASPFAGTPAAHYTDGAAGLVIPSATAVEGFETAEVAYALHTVRRALEAGNLDTSVIEGVSLAPYLDIVGPETRGALEAARAGTAAARSATHFVTIFPSGRQQPELTRVKTAGTFTFRAAGSGALAIEGRHLFAYAVSPRDTADNPERTEILVVRRDTQWRVEHGPDGLAPPELVDSAVATSGHCMLDDEGFVWPRFSTPDGERGRTPAVPVQWGTANPLAPTTVCFAPVASRT